MNNLNINENDDKLNLIKQIYKYKEKGCEINRHYSISDDINELKFQLAILQDNERKFHIEKELKSYEFLFKIKSGLSGELMPPKEELLKFCFGSNEYYEYHKQQLNSTF
jgi:hypothetical protein